MFIQFFFLLLLFTSVFAYGQQITIKVIDKETMNILPRAKIIFTSTKDSTKKKGFYSDDKGICIISDIMNKDFTHCTVSYVGYTDTIITTEDIIRTPYTVIALHYSTTFGESVVIEANRQSIEMSAGKKVVHIDDAISSSGGTAIDVLQTLPGITVDADANVSLRGNSSVTVMIDNKPIRLYGDPAQILKNLPAHVIDNIEIITNPGAKYDAEGQSGIINIHLKKKEDTGFNSTINAAMGSIHNYGLSAQCNSNMKGLNIFYNGDITRGEHDRVTNVETHFFDDRLQSVSTTIRDGYQNNLTEYGGLKIGADIDLSSLDLITISGDIRASKTTINMPSNAAINSGINEINKSYFTTESITTLPFLVGSAGIIHNHKAETKNFEITTEFSYFPTSFGQTADFENRETDRNFLPLASGRATKYTTDLHGISHSWLLQSDIVFSINDTTKIECGAKSYLEGISSNFIFRRFNATTQSYTTDNSQSTKAEHQDNIHSLYCTFQSNYANFTYQLGLRAEYTTNSMSNFIQNNNDSLNFSRNFLNVFPSFSISYPLGEVNSIQMSYSRRINRPDGPMLNPFLDKTDSLIWRTGNPQLMPEFTQAFELGYIHYTEFGLINTELFARFTDNVINPRFREKVSAAIIIEKPINIGKTLNYGLQSGGVIDINTSLKLQSDISLFYQSTEGNDGDVEYFQRSYAWIGKLISTYVLSENTIFQLYAEYTSPIVVTQGKRYEFSFANFAFKQHFYEKKLSLSLNWIDFLNTARFGGIVSGTDFSTELQNRRDFTFLTATLTYRINDAPANQKRKGNEGGGSLIGGGNTL